MSSCQIIKKNASCIGKKTQTKQDPDGENIKGNNRSNEIVKKMHT